MPGPTATETTNKRMANHNGQILPATDATSIPILLPWIRRNDQNASTYVLIIHTGSPTTVPRLEIAPIHPEYEVERLSPTSDTTPANTYHPDDRLAEPSEESLTADLSALSELLDEIKQTRQCPYCQPPQQTQNTSNAVCSPSDFCLYHRRLNKALIKDEAPRSQSGQHSR